MIAVACRATKTAPASAHASLQPARGRGGIGQRSKNPGSTRNIATRAATTPMAAWKPKTRIGSSVLTTSDTSPTAVVPAERQQGSQPRATPRPATPRTPPRASDSSR